LNEERCQLIVQQLARTFKFCCRADFNAYQQNECIRQ